MSIPRALALAAVFAASLAACADQPTAVEPRPEPTPAPLPLGVYEVLIHGADGSGLATSSARLVGPPGGPSQALSSVDSTLGVEQVSITTFTEGSRSAGGHRFVIATFRVRNTTGAALNNLTFIASTRSNSIGGAPFSALLLFNGSSAPASIAPQIVPAGATFMGDDARLRSGYPDVLQVFTEAEVGAIPLPAGVTGLMPYGFVVHNAQDPASRTIPAAANANDFGGLVTFAFRYPLQATAAGDPFTIGFQFVAVQDTETRMTETIEERQDTAGVRRARERATALGATTVTVLAGSPAADPFVTDYPGQRQVCTVRTAGSAASPTMFITRPGPYTELAVYRSGEVWDSCGAYFAAGSASTAAHGVPYNVTVRAMDRYGNVRTTVADTVALTSTDGTAAMPAAAALVNGEASMQVTYTTYGLSTLRAAGRRMRGAAPVTVGPSTKKWTGNVNTNWFTAGDWDVNAVPGTLDSVQIPSDRPNYPVLVQNTTAGTLTMLAGGSTAPFINLSSFDLTLSGDVNLGSTGTFVGTGRLILTGNSNTLTGGLSNFNVRNLRVLGRYTADSNLNVTGGRIVVQGGRLRTTGNRIRVRPS